MSLQKSPIQLFYSPDQILTMVDSPFFIKARLEFFLRSSLYSSKKGLTSFFHLVPSHESTILVKTFSGLEKKVIWLFFCWKKLDSTFFKTRPIDLFIYVGPIKPNTYDPGKIGKIVLGKMCPTYDGRGLNIKFGQKFFFINFFWF